METSSYLSNIFKEASSFLGNQNKSAEKDPGKSTKVEASWKINKLPDTENLYPEFLEKQTGKPQLDNPFRQRIFQSLKTSKSSKEKYQELINLFTELYNYASESRNLNRHFYVKQTENGKIIEEAIIPNKAQNPLIIRQDDNDKSFSIWRLSNNNTEELIFKIFENGHVINKGLEQKEENYHYYHSPLGPNQNIKARLQNHTSKSGIEGTFQFLDKIFKGYFISEKNKDEQLETIIEGLLIDKQAQQIFKGYFSKEGMLVNGRVTTSNDHEVDGPWQDLAPIDQQEYTIDLKQGLNFKAKWDDENNIFRGEECLIDLGSIAKIKISFDLKIPNSSKDHWTDFNSAELIPKNKAQIIIKNKIFREIDFDALAAIKSNNSALKIQSLFNKEEFLNYFKKNEQETLEQLRSLMATKFKKSPKVSKNRKPNSLMVSTVPKDLFIVLLYILGLSAGAYGLFAPMLTKANQNSKTTEDFLFEANPEIAEDFDNLIKDTIKSCSLLDDVKLKESLMDQEKLKALKSEFIKFYREANGNGNEELYPLSYEDMDNFNDAQSKIKLSEQEKMLASIIITEIVSSLNEHLSLTSLKDQEEFLSGLFGIVLDSASSDQTKKINALKKLLEKHISPDRLKDIVNYINYKVITSISSMMSKNQKTLYYASNANLDNTNKPMEALITQATKNEAWYLDECPQLVKTNFKYLKRAYPEDFQKIYDLASTIYKNNGQDTFINNHDTSTDLTAKESSIRRNVYLDTKFKHHFEKIYNTVIAQLLHNNGKRVSEHLIGITEIYNQVSNENKTSFTAHLLGTGKNLYGFYSPLLKQDFNTGWNFIKDHILKNLALEETNLLVRHSIEQDYFLAKAEEAFRNTPVDKIKKIEKALNKIFVSRDFHASEYYEEVNKLMNYDPGSDKNFDFKSGEKEKTITVENASWNYKYNVILLALALAKTPYTDEYRKNNAPLRIGDDGPNQWAEGSDNTLENTYFH